MSIRFASIASGNFFKPFKFQLEPAHLCVKFSFSRFLGAFLAC